MTQPNRDLYQAGAALCDYVAKKYAEAIDHLTREATIIDGFAAKGEQVQVSGGGAVWYVVADEHGEAEAVAVTSVEKAVGVRIDLDDMHADLRYQRATVLLELRKLTELVDKASRMRVPRNKVEPKDKEGRCCSGQAGKEGAVVWGDALCMENGDPRRGGLCPGHYMKWYRHRKAIGVDTSRDFEPA